MAQPQTLTLAINAMGHRGEGIADFEGQKIFVPFTLPGEEVIAERVKDNADLKQVLTPSPDRITPICPHFGACGGCQLQHWADKPYAEFKRQLITTQMEWHGVKAEILPVIDAHGAGRRRATLHVKKGKAGFNALRSHFIHNLDHCPILVPQLSGAAAIARELGRVVGDADIVFTATPMGLDVTIEAKTRPDYRALSNIAVRHDLARLTFGREEILAIRQPALRMGTANVALPPAGFLQATQKGEDVLAQFVMTAAKDADRVADLFCGIGTFALRLAQNAKTLGIDSNGSAVAACTAAMKATPGLKFIDAQTRNLFKDPLKSGEFSGFDTVVIDPPRAGAEAQAHELAASKVSRVISVSCDAKSFARDAAILIAAGFKIGAVQPVDQFRYSAHVEMAAVFER